MSKELKFRAWDKERMIHFEDLTIGLTKQPKKGEPFVYFKQDTFNGQVRFGNHEIMQFTGFQDKNKNDIYDGDILSDYTKTEEGLKKSHCQVYWCQKTGTWRLDLSSGQNKSYSFPLYRELEDYQYEISGNIYENPEHLAKQIDVHI